VSGYWFNVALVLFLVLINAAFAGSEMALVSLREGQLKQVEKEGTGRALRLVHLARPRTGSSQRSRSGSPSPDSSPRRRPPSPSLSRSSPL
jgi:hypothetical protein